MQKRTRTQHTLSFSLFVVLVSPYYYYTKKNIKKNPKNFAYLFPSIYVYLFYIKIIFSFYYSRYVELHSYTYMNSISVTAYSIDCIMLRYIYINIMYNKVKLLNYATLTINYIRFFLLWKAVP